MNNKKTILFIPSNSNHVKIFSLISNFLKTKYDTLFISQDSYKNEGAENTMLRLKIHYKKIEDYNDKNPKSIMRQENIGLVIVGNDTDVIPQWFISSANALNIPSVLVQDGLFFDIKRIKQNKFQKLLNTLNNGTPKLLFLTLLLLFTHQYKRVSDGLGGCTQIHVWGTKSRDYFISKGVDERKIIITGRIGTDQIIECKTQNNHKFILYAPTNMVKTNLISNKTMKNMTTAICSAILSIDNLTLVIKPHDVENTNFYKSLTKKFGSKLQIVDKDIVNLIADSYLLITNLSTTAIDALCMHKPVIIFLPHLESYVEPTTFPRDLILNNIVLYANDKDSLLFNIRTILNGQNKRDSIISNQTLSEYVGPEDGNSVNRSCLNITQLLENTSTSI